MRTPIVTVAVAAAAAQLALLTPTLQAQRPDRTPPERAEQRSPRRDSLPRGERRVERPADSLGACSCSIMDMPDMADATRRLRGLRDMEAMRGEALRRFRDADRPGRDGRLRVWTGPRGEAEGMARAFSLVRPQPDRAMIGVAIGDASPRGLEVAEVTAGGPAERAGIRAGDLLTAIDGTSLRVAPSDSADDLLSGAVARRLTRHLDTLTAGDTIELRVAGSDGAERTVRVATVRSDELPAEGGEAAMASRLARAFAVGRGGAAAIGITPRATLTPRDTLGVFVSAVVPGGRADRAGIHEGMRLAAVNGTDLRVNAADVGDRAVAMARVARLERELAAVDAGDRVTLRVREGAEERDVTLEVGQP